MSNSTAVATVSPLDEIRRAGALAVAEHKAIASIEQQIMAAEWGSGNSVVTGRGMTPHARQALANFCATLGAHPQLHVELLGGKPWLNAHFWYDLALNEESYVDHEEVPIHDNAERRAHWGVPEWATHAWEVVIRRLVNFAPIDKIKSGEITNWKDYVIEHRGANWAGGRPKVKKTGKNGAYEYDPDPVGNAEPAKTSLTRAFRRTAVRTFPAWKKKFEEKIERQERILEAEWEIVMEDRAQARATLPAAGEAQAVVASGEPSAANARGARPLPVEGEIEQGTGASRPVAREGSDGQDSGGQTSEPQQTAKPAFDKEDARKRYFKSLKDAGVTDREQWQKDNGLSASTKDWTKDDYKKAGEALIKPIRDAVLAGCEKLGLDLSDLSLTVIQREKPDYVSHWLALQKDIEVRSARENAASDDDLG